MARSIVLRKQVVRKPHQQDRAIYTTPISLSRFILLSVAEMIEAGLSVAGIVEKSRGGEPLSTNQARRNLSIADFETDKSLQMPQTDVVSVDIF